MIYPIRAYGDPVLRKISSNIDHNYPNLSELIEDMFATMYESNGVGLAAPQIGKNIRLFIIDTNAFDDKKTKKGIKKTFINPIIENEHGEKWDFEEGCLSIPKIREKVSRHAELTIKYQDINFEWHTENYDAMAARVIQHEYDHIEGKLFIDYLSPLKKRLIKGKLDDITKGKVDIDYRMKFYKK